MQIKNLVLGGLETNCYLLIDDSTKETAIIDPAEFTSLMKDYISSEGLVPKYIILTHAHGDHVGGVTPLMEEYPTIQLSACRDEIPVLSNSENNGSGRIYGKSETFEPNVLLEDGDELFLGDTALKIIATPGHTIGGISILAGSTLFSGDTLFCESIGRTDFPTGDYATLVKSVREKLYTLPDDTEVCPGHMGRTTIGHEKQYNGFVRP